MRDCGAHRSAERGTTSQVAVGFAVVVVGVLTFFQVAAATRIEGDSLPSDPRIAALLAYEPPLMMCTRLDNDYLVIAVMPWQVDYLSQGAGVDENARLNMGIFVEAFERLEAIFGESPGSVFILADDANSPDGQLEDKFGRTEVAICEPDLPNRFDEVIHHFVHAFDIGAVFSPGYLQLSIDKDFTRWIPATSGAERDALATGYRSSLLNEGVPIYLQFLITSEVTGSREFLGKLVETYLVYRRLTASPRFRELAPPYFEGAAVNWALDQLIQRESGGTKSISDFLGALMKECWGASFSLKKYLSILYRSTGVDGSTFVHEFLSGNPVTVTIPDEYWQAYRDLIACRCANPHSLRGEWAPYPGAVPEAAYFVSFEVCAVTPAPPPNQAMWGPHLAFHGTTSGLDDEGVLKWLYALRSICQTPAEVTENLVEEALEIATGEDESRFFEAWSDLGFEVSVADLRDFVAGHYARMLVKPTSSPEAALLSDGVPGTEWDGVVPAWRDCERDTSFPGADIVCVYAVVRDETLLIRVDCGSELQPLSYKYLLSLELDGARAYIESWMSFPTKLSVVRGDSWFQYYATSCVGDILEVAVPIDILGYPQTIGLTVTTRLFDERDEYVLDSAGPIVVGERPVQE